MPLGLIKARRWGLLFLLALGMTATIAALVVSGVTITSQRENERSRDRILAQLIKQVAADQHRVCRVAKNDRMVLRNLLKLAQYNT